MQQNGKLLKGFFVLHFLQPTTFFFYDGARPLAAYYENCVSVPHQFLTQPFFQQFFVAPSIICHLQYSEYSRVRCAPLRVTCVGPLVLFVLD